MMSGEAWLYLLAVLINAVNLFLQVFFTIMYSDLEWYASQLLQLRSPQILPSLLRSSGVARRLYMELFKNKKCHGDDADFPF
jgi:hypothetical protein